MTQDELGEAQRLEGVWAGPFGDAYNERNAAAATGRDVFWRQILAITTPSTVLEVGCNIGGNLHWLVDLLPEAQIAAVDINQRAVDRVRAAYPAVDIHRAPATELPFDDRSFDLVFTTGVLIHLPDEALHRAMDEIVRCSTHYLLCGEYFGDPPGAVRYRGLDGALFKRDYGRLYRERYPELRSLATGFLARGESGWDDLTWWLFECP